MRHYPVESLKAFMERRGLRTTSDSRSGGNPEMPIDAYLTEEAARRFNLVEETLFLSGVPAARRLVWIMTNPFAADLMACAETNS